MGIINYDVLEDAIKDIEIALDNLDAFEKKTVLICVDDRMRAKEMESAHRDAMSKTNWQEVHKQYVKQVSKKDDDAYN